MKKALCPYCQKEYDYFEKKCPYCQEPNDQNRTIKKFPNIAFINIWKALFLFLLGWLGFQIIGTIITILVQLCSGNLKGDLNIKQSTIVFALSYFLLIIAQLFLAWNDNKKIFKSFANYKAVIFGIVGFFAIIIFNQVYDTLIDLLNLPKASNQNQSNIESVVTNFPIISLIIIGFVGPMVEELTYRVGLFSVLRRKNRALAYIVTIVVFAFIHFDFAGLLNLSINNGIKSPEFTNSLIIELINIPSYLCGAAIITTIYEHYGFAGSYYTHVSNNLLSFIGIILSINMK